MSGTISVKLITSANPGGSPLNTGNAATKLADTTTFPDNATTIIEATFTGTGKTDGWEELTKATIDSGFDAYGLDDTSIGNRTLKVKVVDYNGIWNAFSTMNESSKLNIVDLSGMVANNNLGEGQTQGLDGYAFSGCTNLQEITLFSNCAEIEIGAFFNCNNLLKIYEIPSGMSAQTSGENTIFGGIENANTIAIFDIALSITGRGQVGSNNASAATISYSPVSAPSPEIIVQTYNVTATAILIGETDHQASIIFSETVAAALTPPTIGYKSYSAPQVPNKLEVEVTNDGDAKVDTYSYQWERSSDNGANWTKIDGVTSATYEFDESSDKTKSFRAVVEFEYTDGNDGTANSIARPYIPPTWNTVPNDKTKATVGEEYTYSPTTTSAESPTYYLLNGPSWLSLNSSDSSTLTGTPTTEDIVEDPKTVELAVVEDSVFYMASVLEFTITVSAALTPPTIVYSTDNNIGIDATRNDLTTNRANVKVTKGSASDFTYQWQSSDYKSVSLEDLEGWNDIGDAIDAEYTFKDDDAQKAFRAIVSYTYDGSKISKELSRIDYFPTVWTNESKQDKTATVGEEFTFSPESDDDGNGDWYYYLLESPAWLEFTADYRQDDTETDNIPTASYPAQVKGTPTVPGEYTVKIAGGEQVFYRMSVLEFKITVPFKTKTALQTAIDKWYALANNENETTANNYEGPEYFGNPNTWDVSLITDLSYVFFKKDQDNHPDISTWNVSNVTTMQGTFSNSTFNGELKNWNVASVTDFSYTFANNVVFNQELKRWNVQDATTMKSMFDNAYSFNQTIEPPMVQNKDGTDFPTQLTWDEEKVNGYLTTIYGSATNTDTSETPQTNPTTFKGVFGMIALLKKTYLDNIPTNRADGGKYNTIKESFSEVISELITNQQEILKYNYTYDKTDGWTKTTPSIYFANTKDKSGDDLNDAKDSLNQLRLNTIVYGMLLINKAYDIAKGLGANYSDLSSEMENIYDDVYNKLPFYVAWYAPLLTTKANFLNNAFTFHNGATDGNIETKLTDFIATNPNPIKTINGNTYEAANNVKSEIVQSSSFDLYQSFANAYNPTSSS